MKEEKKKILLVHNYYQQAGGEDIVFANEKKLLEINGHEVITYTRENVEINSYNLLKKLLYPINAVFSIKTFIDVKDIIKKENIEIVHVHNTWPLISPSVFYAAFFSKIPVIQTVHNFRLICPGGTLYFNGKIDEGSLHEGLRSAFRKKIYKDSYTHTLISILSLKFHRLIGTYKKVNFIFLTEFTQRKVLELNNSKNEIISENKTFVKPNFIFNTEGKSNFREYYIYVGRLEESKGIPILIEAFSKLPNKKLLIVGTGTLENDVKETIKEKNVQNIHLLGFKNNNDVNKLLKNAKALIMCSQLYETFGMVITEAYANKTPVIVGDIGNIKDLVISKETGLKFKYDSSEDLIQTIKKFEIIDSEEMGENAYKYFLKNFSSSTNYVKLQEIYSLCWKNK